MIIRTSIEGSQGQAGYRGAPTKSPRIEPALPYGRVVHLVFLHGRPASGKLTTARSLSARVGYPVFHNHLVVDLLTTVFTFGTPQFVRLREEMWLSTFAAAAEDDRSIIFTFAPDATVTSGFPDRVRETVESRDGQIHFVRLTVSELEQERRVVDPSRAEFHKLRSLELLRRPSDAVGEEPPVDLLIDTDRHRPEESAAMVAATFSLPLQEPVPRYFS